MARTLWLDCIKLNLVHLHFVIIVTMKRIFTNS